MDALRAQDLTHSAGNKAVERLARLDDLFPARPRQLPYAEYIARATEYARQNPIFALQLADAERKRQARLGG
jgi:hypothetical protein